MSRPVRIGGSKYHTRREDDGSLAAFDHTGQVIAREPYRSHLIAAVRRYHQRHHVDYRPGGDQ